VVRVGCADHAIVVGIYIVDSAWSIKIGISVKEESVAVNRVCAGFGAILLDALP